MEKEKDQFGAEFRFNYTWLEKIPADVEEYVVPEGVERIRKGATADCKKLRKIVLPTTLKAMEDDEFNHIETLQEVIVSEEWVNHYHYEAEHLTCNAWIIEESKEGRKLLHSPQPKIDWNVGMDFPKIKKEKLKVPEGITCIGQDSFKNYPNTKEIILPESLKQLEWGSFLLCYGLERIVFLSATPPEFDDDAFLINEYTLDPDEDKYADLDEETMELMSDEELGLETVCQYFEGTILVPKGCREEYENTFLNDKLHVEEWERLEE